MKQYFYKKFLFTLLVSSAWPLQTTYIIYKIKNMSTVEAPTQAEFNKAYEILMTYQFPMSMDNGQDEISTINDLLNNPKDLYYSNKLNYLRIIDAIPSNVSDGEELKKYLGAEKNLEKVKDALLHRIKKLEKESNYTKFIALTSDEQKKLIQHEQDFLTEKIKKIDSSLRLSFIPTTLYELLFFKFYITGLQNLSWKTKYSFVLEDNTLINFDELSFAGNLAASSARNTSKLMCELQHDINTRIIHFFDDTYNKIQCKPDDVKNLMPSLLKSLKIISDKAYENISSIIVGYFSRIEDSKDILSKTIEAEFEANSKHCFAVYRGTKGFEDTLDKIIGAGKHGSFLGGISYGNSLFGGIFMDPKACAYSYILESELGYVLLIPKETYRTIAKSTNQMSLFKTDETTGISYYIPPLSMLCGMLSGGEYFHPRLKAFNQKDKAIEHNFQTLISTNARIIKNKSTFTDKQLTEVQPTEGMAVEKLAIGLSDLQFA